MPKKPKTYWVGFDLGGTKMSAYVFNNSFHILGKVKVKTPARQGFKACLEKIKAVILEALNQAGVIPATLSGIGIGYAGTVNTEKGRILSSPNIGWTQVPLIKELRKSFKCPILLLNDVDAGVYGEYLFGAGRKSRCLAGIFIGTGIGGGCVYEGKIIQGMNSSCFEIGHMQMMPHGPLCGCGKRGCLEAMASRLAVSAAAAISVYRGQSPALHKAAGMDLSAIKSGELAASVKSKDKVVLQILKESAGWIGMAAANLVNLILPDRIILGGGMAEAMPELFCREVFYAARERVMPVFRDQFKVVCAKLGDDATAMGAAAWVKEKTGSLK
ncbi:MAG: ROK family protein [Candidatus Aureabacteria bacterium]|nr:ROK family protein [Candidatus Auribacterota bacterium]